MLVSIQMILFLVFCLAASFWFCFVGLGSAYVGCVCYCAYYLFGVVINFGVCFCLGVLLVADSLCFCLFGW